MAYTYVGTKYIKRPWDFENFLEFWCTLLYIVYSLLESFCTLEGVAIWGFSLKLHLPSTIHQTLLFYPSNPLLMFPIFLHRIHFGQFFSTQNVQYLLLKSFANVCQTSNPSAPSSNWNWSLKLCLTRLGSAACAKLNLPPMHCSVFQIPPARSAILFHGARLFRLNSLSIVSY